jgi:two-component system, chemotaxis family, sensor kinase CheA
MSKTASHVNEENSGEFDLTQYYQVFFVEAAENLASMENMLLKIAVEDPLEEDLHAIFRVAHSVKGGAATFGFQDVVELTHELETLLDRVRKHEITLTTEIVDTLLEAGDVLKAQLARHQAGGGSEIEDTSALLARVRMLAKGGVAAADEPDHVFRNLEMAIGPLADKSIFDDIVDLFSEIPSLGTIAPIKGAKGVRNKGVRRFRVVTATPTDELCDLLSFHVSREQVQFTTIGTTNATNSITQDGCEKHPPAQTAQSDPGDGFSPGHDAAMAPGVHAAAPVEIAASSPGARPEPSSNPGADASTLRVSVDKVDQLINLVGELVITQAMLANRGRTIDPIAHEGILSGFADLERNTRSLQEAVMSIRMIPMAVVFNRFPRMLRDLAAKLGKEIDLKSSGEATELDKGLIEKITDPLNHLIRNSADHGIESPQARIAAGKPARGTIFLSASHQGGSILIEVRDDGAGLNRERILAKANKQGLAVRKDMPDKEVWQLIWAPGFSTAEQVTDVSGRGVGMDVVTKSITALGGTAEIDSAEGRGTRVSIRLPLTLAIMDGMSVAVNGEHYIVPLTNVVESMQITDGMLRSVVGQGRVVEVRGDYLPVVTLHEVFNVPPRPVALPDVTNLKSAGTSRILVILEFEGAKTALVVDQLIGQYQVVVKNLEANYRKVPGVSGATIMGDGRVALILDVAQVVDAGNNTVANTSSAAHTH